MNLPSCHLQELTYLILVLLTMRIIRSKAINIRNYLSSFFNCRIFTHRRHGIIIRPLVVPKIFCFSCINIWFNLLDPFGKIQMVTRMQVDRNKGIYPDFFRDVLDLCIDYHDEMPLGDTSMNLPLRHIQELPCLSLSFFVSSSFGPASVTPYHAHYWVVWFQSQNSGDGVTRLCTFLLRIMCYVFPSN